MWSGDADYEIFKVHEWPTNMAVDLDKRSCTWMPCMHACAALARVGKKPDKFCHYWLTMEAYNNTYAFHINPIPGQALWEKSSHNRPQAPKFKKKPRPIKKNRRKDADEEPSRGHTKRNCRKRAVDEESAIVAVAAAVNGGDAPPVPQD
ncbi:uncharacterized protein LOC107626897 [Arachis ipaensis]|uniref:uncharacterized protein LOC107626897 n=1 Tax=Arachis ipaensis TaxID=130454 RepID=UPI0007AF1609|nr:uncharacterized protein LOC107626897 [Arachis ipaensis]XP_025635685.1 uncharacterized protein LOC112729747 [Arachis hypogaea]